MISLNQRAIGTLRNETERNGTERNQLRGPQ